MRRFANSWALARRSFAVLRAEKSLAWFPCLGAVAHLVSAAALVALGFAVGAGAPQLEGRASVAVGPLMWVFVFVGYFVEAVVATYFLAALVAAADQYLRGEKPSLGSGFAAANACLARLVQWSFVVATVSVVLGALRRNGGAAGGAGAGLLGAAWNVFAYLTIPIILAERLGPVRAFKRSAAVFKQTWGENVVAHVGLGVLGLAVILPPMGLLVAGVALGSVTVLTVFAVVAFAWALVGALFVQTLSGIYRAALYRYAIDGITPAAFGGAGLADAFGPRGVR